MAKKAVSSLEKPIYIRLSGLILNSETASSVPIAARKRLKFDTISFFW